MTKKTCWGSRSSWCLYYDWHRCLHFREGKFICLLVSVSWQEL